MNKTIWVFFLPVLSTLCHCYESLKLDSRNFDLYGNETLRRFVRQADSCRQDPTKFQCETNPDCIDNDRQCDGIEDCPDGSDEKQSLCQSFTCPGYLFRCDYGACISRDQRCNGVKDCKDNSDEAGCPSGFEKINTNCRSDQFSCDNGECIDTDARCNGVAECKDKSDETEGLCLNVECPGYTYKCRYGACVDGTARCNGIKECFDNSDEDETTCGIQTPKPPVTPVTGTPPGGETGPSNYCTTPPQPANGKWVYFVNEFQAALENKRVPPKTQIVFSCNNNYQLSVIGNKADEEIVYCRGDGQWSKTIFPECKQLCQKYRNQYHAILQCKLDGTIIPCDRATHETQLTYKCDPYYEPQTAHQVNVCLDGTWKSPEPRCSEICGEKQVSAQTLVVNGKVVKRGHYPWVTAIFSNRGNDNPSIFTNICGGSLLSTSIVLTAAHCVTVQASGQPYAIKFYRVAAGKYYNKYMDTRDSDTAQYLQIKLIYKHDEYRGEVQHFRYDIALLKLADVFALSKVVQPVCLNGLPPLGIRGTATATGWGYTTSSGKPADVLQEIDLEYIDNDKCHGELESDFANRYLVRDKLCAGFLNRSMGVCQGDSGGGLVVKGNNERYYVEGIVSLAHSFKENSQTHCDIQRRALFTRVEEYLDWIQYSMQIID